MSNLDEALTQHILEEEKRLMLIEQRMVLLEKSLASLDAGVSDLVSAWKTAGNLVSFVKWLAGLGAALLALVAFIKSGYFHS